MVVKSKTGRRRYIVFKIVEGEAITRKDLIYTFNRRLPRNRDEIFRIDNNDQLKSNSSLKNQNSRRSNTKKDDYVPILRHRLKYFDGQFGVLLTPHWHKSEAIIILQSLDRIGVLNKPVKIEPIGTSGSIKKAMKKYLG